MTKLRGKVALVTAAARGIGRAVSLELACRGAAVAVHYRTSRTEADELVDRIRTMGVPAMLVLGNTASAEEATAMVRQVVGAWGRLDILVNNAGITRDKSMRKASDDEWADVTTVDLNGTLFCTRAVIPVMVEQNFGRIVSISSCVGQAGNFEQANYAASKGGIIAFTKTLALELARHNITANAVTPGFTDTGMLSELPPNIQEQLKAKIPLGRFGMPEEVAKAVAFLASEGDYITGQQISVNGGICM